MLNQAIKFAGRIPAGNYQVKVKDIKLLEDVSMYHDALPKEICGKEKSTLKPDQIAKIEAFDWGEDGLFDNGQSKPRFQNMIAFDFEEPKSGKTFPFDIKFYGGPAIPAKMGKFLEQITGMSQDEMTDKTLDEICGNGMLFNASIEIREDNYNHIVKDTIRKVGLAAIASENEESGMSEEVDSNGFTPSENRLIKYLQNEGKGMLLSLAPKLSTMNIQVDGQLLGDFAHVMHAWNSLKGGKVKQFSADGETVDIIVA